MPVTEVEEPVNDHGSGMMSGPPAQWQDLTKEQQCVLFSAAEKSMLIGVLANWEPELDWPGRAQNISRLAAAATDLLRAGLIQVYEQHLGGGDARLLAEPEAFAVLSDPDSWWRAENAGEDDAEVAGAGDGERGDSYCSLAVTDAGSTAMHTRGEAELYGFLRH